MDPTKTSEAKHTPGPWEVDGTRALGAYGVWTEYGTHPGHDGDLYPSQICSVYPMHESNFDRETRDANASLIAAAPELLTACSTLLDSYADLCKRSFLNPDDFGVVVAARSAIAKAATGSRRFALAKPENGGVEAEKPTP